MKKISKKEISKFMSYLGKQNIKKNPLTPERAAWMGSKGKGIKKTRLNKATE